jgi:hypothetical protein
MGLNALQKQGGVQSVCLDSLSWLVKIDSEAIEIGSSSIRVDFLSIG